MFSQSFTLLFIQSAMICFTIKRHLTQCFVGFGFFLVITLKFDLWFGWCFVCVCVRVRVSD